MQQIQQMQQQHIDQMQTHSRDVLMQQQKIQMMMDAALGAAAGAGVQGGLQTSALSQAGQPLSSTPVQVPASVSQKAPQQAQPTKELKNSVSLLLPLKVYPFEHYRGRLLPFA